MFFQKRKKAREILMSSQQLSDEDFVNAVEVDCNNSHIVVAIRKIFSDICAVPKENITPETKFIVLTNAMRSGMLTGWDRMDFVFRLQKELKKAIILPRDVLSSLYSVNLDSITFETILLELVKKMEIQGSNLHSET